MTDLHYTSATELSRRIRRKEISAREVIEAHLAQIERHNPALNAIVTHTHEQARATALALDEQQAKGQALGLLHGLPVAHKDLMLTKGVRTTFGSPIYKDFVPNENMLIVERQHQAGAVMVGKSNTPEFGAGSQTFNAVFGKTKNPYDQSKTCGGSSGGGAVALAAGMVALADGSDLGASLRNPASFCNLVGHRPSIGRVPAWPVPNVYWDLGVEGGMARTVEDMALFMTVLCGPDARVPTSLAEPGSSFLRPLGRNFKGTKIAWSADMAGTAPVAHEVVAALNAQRGTFEALGCITEEALPDFADGAFIFETQRAHYFAIARAADYAAHKTLMKDTVQWNIEAGLKLTAQDLGRAAYLRTALYQRVNTFFAQYEFLILPASQVLPFSVDEPFPKTINGQIMGNYLDWMKCCYYITITGHPAVSVPCGFSADGLPVGVQIVGRHQDDFGVLQLAYAFEQATKFGERRPVL